VSFCGVGADPIPLEEAHYDAAVSAFLRFGKGRHSAGLNFGDCLSYAAASVAGMPLLFPGRDFRRTGIGVA
jgi:ribonuclease VapC